MELRREFQFCLLQYFSSLLSPCAPIFLFLTVSLCFNISLPCCLPVLQYFSSLLSTCAPIFLFLAVYLCSNIYLPCCLPVLAESLKLLSNERSSLCFVHFEFLIPASCYFAPAGILILTIFIPNFITGLANQLLFLISVVFNLK